MSVFAPFGAWPGSVSMYFSLTTLVSATGVFFLGMSVYSLLAGHRELGRLRRGRLADETRPVETRLIGGRQAQLQHGDGRARIADLQRLVEGGEGLVGTVGALQNHLALDAVD